MKCESRDFGTLAPASPAPGKALPQIGLGKPCGKRIVVGYTLK
jgi:hypothetical protein